MIDTQALVLDNLRAAAKELPVCKSHLKSVCELERLMSRLNELQAEDIQELLSINEEHATFMQLHLKKIGEFATNPRRVEIASIVKQIGEIKP
jgi:hypothetical protein